MNIMVDGDYFDVDYFENYDDDYAMLIIMVDDDYYG
jgi:hypothetical protein